MIDVILLYATLGMLSTSSPIERCREFTPAFCIKDSDLKFDRSITYSKYIEYRLYKSYWDEGYYKIVLPKSCRPRGEWTYKGVGSGKTMVYYEAPGCKISVEFNFSNDVELDSEITSWFTEIMFCRDKKICEQINANIVNPRRFKEEILSAK